MSEKTKSISSVFSRLVFPVIIAVAGIFGLGMVQSHVDTLRDLDVNDELLYFPNAKSLRYFTAGLDNVVADFMWYRTVQYTAQEFNSQEKKFEWLDHMVGIVTSLDPHYIDAYRYGGLFLALIDAEELSIPILKEGFRNNPLSWEIPYELHTIYLMNRRDQEGSRVIASHYALLVAERHENDYRQFYIELAQSLLSGEDMHDEAIAIMTIAVRDATDPFLKKQAETRLLYAHIEKNLSVLRKTAALYVSSIGKPIESIEDLIDAGLIDTSGENADEGEYFVDASGFIQNEVIVANIESRLRSRINRHLREFQEEIGRNPRSLDELTTHRGKPPYGHPLPDKDWVYNSATDELTVQ